MSFGSFGSASKRALGSLKARVCCIKSQVKQKINSFYKIILELYHPSVYLLKVINLPKPYESNCYDGKMDGITDHTTYTISSCLSLCEARSLIKECGCRNMEMSGEFSNDTLLNY